jgi:hypothetical protein
VAGKGSFSTLSPAHPLLWGVLGLFFSFSSSFLGEKRLLVLMVAFALLLASILALARPRWMRWLRLSVGILLTLLFGYALFLRGPSLFVFGFLVAGVWELLHGLLGATDINEDLPEEEAQEDDGENERRTRKRRRIAELLNEDDPSELFSRVFDRIVRRYGGDLNVRDLKEHERSFLLAYDACGIIGNGGFNYLFERNIRGDPHFEETASAFKAIGCDAAAEAFAQVFRLFPDGRPPEDVGERLRLYRSGSGERRGPIDEQFWDANKEIERCLLAYVQAHGQELAELDRLPPRRRAKKRKRRPLIDENAGPTTRDLVTSLPHWARVAFAAHCGRSVWPLFTANWPDARVERQQAVTRAIELAEKSAASAHEVEGLEAARTKALITAGAATMGLYGFSFNKKEEPLPSDGNTAVVASCVARTAEQAAKAAIDPPATSVESTLGAFGFARQAAGDTSDCIETLWRELIHLERVARRDEWTDQTPVPANVWDLLE